MEINKKILERAEFVTEVVNATDRELLEFIAVQVGLDIYRKTENWEIATNYLKHSKN